MHTCLDSIIHKSLVGDITGVLCEWDNLHCRDSDVEPSSTVFKVTHVGLVVEVSWQLWTADCHIQLDQELT